MTVAPEHDIGGADALERDRDSGSAAASSARPRTASDAEAPSDAKINQAPDGASDAAPPAEEKQQEGAAGEPPGEDATAAAAPVESEAHADHEHQLEQDLEELAAKAQKADEYLELAKRTKADFENYRKRAAREAAAAQERGVVKLARELLPAVDNLDRALAAAESSGPEQSGESEASSDGTATLVSGVKLVHAEVISALARAGIERFSPEGEQFDPERHEAVAQQPVQGTAPGTIVEVYQRGYRSGDSIIRPARVVVAG